MLQLEIKELNAVLIQSLHRHVSHVLSRTRLIRNVNSINYSRSEGPKTFKFIGRVHKEVCLFVDFWTWDRILMAAARHQREHSIFTAYVLASFPCDPNRIASSSVCVDDLIHIYAFTLKDFEHDCTHIFKTWQGILPFLMGGFWCCSRSETSSKCTFYSVSWFLWFSFWSVN